MHRRAPLCVLALAGLQLAAVAHGPALCVLRAQTDSEPLKREFASRREAGERCFACGATPAAHQRTLDGLMPGFLVAKGRRRRQACRSASPGLDLTQALTMP